MADYRHWTTCKECEIGEISSFGGECPVCGARRQDKYVQSFVDLYRENPEEAIAALASAVYQAKKARRYR